MELDSEPLYTGVLLVDLNFQALAPRFVVETTSDACIMVLKENAQEIRPDELSSFDRPELSVWKIKGDKIIENLTPRELSEILGRIDVNDEDTIEEVDEDENVANLGLSHSETLLLQLPGTSHISTIAACVLIQF
jgi:hypothetical protein